MINPLGASPSRRSSALFSADMPSLSRLAKLVSLPNRRTTTLGVLSEPLVTGSVLTRRLIFLWAETAKSNFPSWAAFSSRVRPQLFSMITRQMAS
ncbi:hypothetical protein D3C81_1381920 [compost metagenome]